MIAPLLSGFPVVRAAHTGKLRDAVDGLTGYDHAVRDQGVANGGPHSGPPGVVNGLRREEVSLVFVAYATDVTVVAPPTDDRVVLVLPRGPMRVGVAGREITATAPFVLSASAETTMHPDPGAGALVGAVPRSEVFAALASSFGAHTEFSVDLDQSRPIPLNAATALSRVWSRFAASPAPDIDPLIDSLVVGLAPFTRLRNDTVVDWASPPAYLEQAVRHLRRNLAEPVSIGELGELVGIGTRQLQLAFRAHFGCTAQEYLRDARLDRAWALLRGQSGAVVGAGQRPGGSARSVSSVAAEVGIPHAGRFAQYFGERFGVLPSTLGDPDLGDSEGS